MATKSAKASREKIAAAARKRAEQLNKSPFYKLAVGDNSFRILPTPASKKTGELWYEYNIHRDVGAAKKFVRCGKSPESDEGVCWICDRLVPALKKKGFEKRAAALAYQHTAMIQVAKVTMEGDEQQFSGPLLFQPSANVFRQLLTKAFGSKRRSYTDPTEGYNLNLDRSGTGKNDTRYGILEGDDDPSEVPESIIAKLKPFSELKEIPAYDEATQKAAWANKDAAPDDDEDEDDLEETEDEDEAPPKKKKKPPVEDDDEDEPPAKKKKKPAAEDDDEDNADADDDDEDEAPPAKKKAKKQADDDDEDEADAGDTDDDDEDEAPPKKKPAAKKKPPVDDEEDEDEDPAPAKKKKKPAPADDDDEDEGDALDDDDEDEAPPKKKKKPADDDDDDGDTDDEDEDEPPAKKKVAAKKRAK